MSTLLAFHAAQEDLIGGGKKGIDRMILSYEKFFQGLFDIGMQRSLPLIFV